MKVTNKLGLPQPFVSAAESNYQYIPKRYSVTSLTNGVRQTILERRHDDEIVVDASDRVWSVFGKAVHLLLEQAPGTETQIKEGHVEFKLENGYTLSGYYDLYDTATKTVYDYKTSKVWKAIYDEWDDFRTQVLAYCWLLRKMGDDAQNGEVFCLLKDHTVTKVGTKADYPEHPAVVKRWEFTGADFEEIEARIHERFTELERCEQLQDDDLPLCTKEERWAKDDVYAVTKKGNKKATKLFTSEQEAIEDANAREEKTGNAYEVIFRPGEDMRCKHYCSCRQFCKHYHEIMEERDGE